MSHLQIIEELCSLVEQQARLIRRLTIALENARSLTEEEQRSITAAQQSYAALLCIDDDPGSQTNIK